MAPAFLLAAVVADTLNRHVDALTPAQLLSQPIATLVDAQRQAAGARLIALEAPGWLIAILAEAFALFWFWRSGSAARWRDAIRRRLGNENAVRFTFGATLALIARAAAIIPAFYLWRVERVMGLAQALTRVWFYEYVLGTILGMLVAGCVAAVILWLVARTHQWYLYAAGGIVAISLIATLVSPYLALFDRYEPLPAAPARAARAFASEAGYVGIPILVGHRLDRIPIEAATTEGMGATQRIVLAESVVGASTPGEIDFYVADEIARLDAHDPLRLALIDALIVIVGVAIAVVIADRLGFRRDDDPVSRLALAGALLAIVYVIAVPVDHAAVASMQLSADRQALAMTHDRASALRAFVRAGDERIEQVCPTAPGRLFLYRTPPLGARAAALGSTSGCPS